MAGSVQGFVALANGLFVLSTEVGKITQFNLTTLKVFTSFLDLQSGEFVFPSFSVISALLYCLNPFGLKNMYELFLSWEFHTQIVTI